MARVLQIMSIFILISAGGVLVRCPRLWSQGQRQEQDHPGIAERRPGRGSFREEDEYRDTSPLVKEAAAFALYLKPPEPRAPAASQPAPRLTTPAPPVVRPPSVTPKFRLLSTTYYRSRPERSLALISEPGKGAYWVGSGTQLGHVVIETVHQGTIVYREGNQLREMTIAGKDTAPLAHAGSDALLSSPGTAPNVRFVNAAPPGDYGLAVPGVPPVTDEGPE